MVGKPNLQGLVKFIADGDDSKYVRHTLRDLEAQARIDSTALDDLKRAAKAPLNLPSPEVLLNRARDFENVLTARGTFLPLAAVATDSTGARSDEEGGAHGSPVAVPFQVTMPKPPDRRGRRPTKDPTMS